METKIVLTSIREDIAHLEGITAEFELNSLPAPEEIELALVRATTIVRQLELLQKISTKSEKNKVSDSVTLDPNENNVSTRNSQLTEEVIQLPESLNLNIEATSKAAPIEISTDEVVEPTVFPIQEIDTPEPTLENKELLKDLPEEVVINSEQVTADKHELVDEMLSQGQGDTGYPTLSINSMWDGIGLNDRFLYIRELFENNPATFENAVNALDKMENIQQVVSYLKINFQWNKSEASQKFLALVKRRFTN